MNEIIKKNGLTFGIILGLAGILSQISTYIIGKSEATASFIGVIFWLIYIVIRIVQINKVKKELNGIISFKEGFTSLFICVLNGILISQLFTYIFMNHIDLEYGMELNKFMNDKAIEASYYVSKLAGEKIKTEDMKIIAETNNFSPLKLLQGSLIAILVSSILNLILAAIFKTKTNNSPFNE